MSVAYFLLLSSLGLAMNTQAQNCSAPVGGDNMGLKGADILLQTFPNGAKVSFACNVGYRSAGGSPSITCTDGSWSPVRLKCEKRNCGPAGEVVNGNVDYPEGTEFGSKLVVTCNTGYRSVPKIQGIFCGAEGWLDRLPECEAVTCNPPDPVVHGTFSPIKESYDFLEVVQFYCQDDYTLSGSKSLSCSEDGTFKPAFPTCIKVQCEEPVIKNAAWDGGSRPPHNYKATVTYKCISGYTMKGERTQTCGIDSQWSPGLPTCEPVQCKVPVVENATRDDGSLPPYNYTSTVTFKCKSGYAMKGEHTQTCGIDGQWSPGLPTCELVQCELPVVENAARDDDSRPPHIHKTTVTFKCKSGYTMKGERTQTCGIDGQWSPGLPTCESVQCELPVVENAARDDDSRPPHIHKTTVTFKCISGYTMKGERTQTCGIDGQWSPGLPTCELNNGNDHHKWKTPVIVVGVLSGVLAIAGGIYWAFFKKKTRKHAVGPPMLAVTMAA
ncbi:complement component receptor 1-like protein isoform X2 [Cebidichthys violaceus]|uniref:complement component receptor 1-like protein isoform X2 n=1 Tax=Cebidichthys violaceus TaxID=271503 RepID=UPI0035CBFD7C